MEPIVRVRRIPPAEMGALLAAARARAGLGLRQCARLAGIGQSHLWRLEHAERTPSLSVAGALADVLDLNVSERAELFAAALPEAGRDYPGRRRRGTPIGSRGGAHGQRETPI